MTVALMANAEVADETRHTDLWMFIELLKGKIEDVGSRVDDNGFTEINWIMDKVSALAAGGLP